jgi:hypothetical protein
LVSAHSSRWIFDFGHCGPGTADTLFFGTARVDRNRGLDTIAGRN